MNQHPDNFKNAGIEPFKLFVYAFIGLKGLILSLVSTHCYNQPELVDNYALLDLSYFILFIVGLGPFFNYFI